MIGLDTGFFVELLRGREDVAAVWKHLIEGEEEAAVSCLSLFEIERLGLKGAIREIEVLLEAIPAVCRIVWIQSGELLSSGAGLSHGLGIPAMDALILAGLIAQGAITVYTTDSHLETYRRKGIKIVNLAAKT